VTQSSLYTVGVILKPHGLRGDVKVFPRTDFPETRFAKHSKLFLQSPDGGPTVALEVEASRKHKNVYIVKFKQFSSIDEVERFRGWELKVNEAQLLPLPEGTYYFHELIGCTVITDQGETLGELAEILQPGANDVYVVRGFEGKEILLPAIADCILDVDVENKMIHVHILPGLLDE
jgi:16S rRNA processing protein RimM